METKKKAFKDLSDQELVIGASRLAYMLKMFSIEIQTRNHNGQLDKRIDQRFLKDLGWCEFYGNEVLKRSDKILDKFEAKPKESPKKEKLTDSSHHN